MNDTFTQIFVARKVKSREDESLVYVRLTLNQERKEFGLRIRIKSSEWDSKAQRLKGKSQTIKTINDQLELIANKYNRIFSEIKFNKGVVHLDEIIARFDGTDISTKQHTLLEIFEKHNKRAFELIGKNYAKATYQRFHTTKAHVEEFLKSKKKKDIALTDLNKGFLIDMEHYFKSKKDCNHNTTVKYIRIVMMIARLGIDYGWISKDPFFGYKQSLQEVKRGHLLEDELERLENTDIPNKRIEVIRDMFVFCCYTGLAYADVSKLKPSNIITYPDGSLWINTSRTKTDVDSNIPLLPKAVEIIEKYKDHPETDVKGTVLPLRSNVKFNAYLKEVADLCGIEKNLTTHLARHTFATTVTLNNDVPLESVSKMLGHKNVKTTQIYAKVLDKKVGADMKILQEKLYGKKDETVE
jgi:integrase